MKTTIDAARTLLDTLHDVQQQTTEKTSAIQKAINAVIAAEAGVTLTAMQEEEQRHTAFMERLHAIAATADEEHAMRKLTIQTRAGNRDEALHKLLDAVMRLQGDLQDGNDDGAAAIAARFAPPAARNPDGTPVRQVTVDGG